MIGTDIAKRIVSKPKAEKKNLAFPAPPQNLRSHYWGLQCKEDSKQANHFPSFQVLHEPGRVCHLFERLRMCRRSFPFQGEWTVARIPQWMFAWPCPGRVSSSCILWRWWNCVDLHLEVIVYELGWAGLGVCMHGENHCKEVLGNYRWITEQSQVSMKHVFFASCRCERSL